MHMRVCICIVVYTVIYRCAHGQTRAVLVRGLRYPRTYSAQALRLKRGSHGGNMGEGYYAGVSSDANSDAEAPEKPLRLTKAWRRGRVPLSCTHWNKRKALPLLKLRRFLAMPVPAFNPFAPTLGTIVDQEKDAQAWYAGLKKKKALPQRQVVHGVQSHGARRRSRNSSAAHRGVRGTRNELAKGGKGATGRGRSTAGDDGGQSAIEGAPLPRRAVCAPVVG